MPKERTRNLRAITLLIAVLAWGCSRESPQAITPAARTSERPSILLITLDTTRADSIGPGAKGIDTPVFDAITRSGQRFLQAYATVPETLPSHVSMMTGLYPAAHNVHENGRYLGADTPLLAEQLQKAGYRTAAFVSAYPVAQQFGLARGFEIYDDDFGDQSERSARETTDRAIAHLTSERRTPLFLWVHYFEPHHPYEPPEPFRSRYAKDPYRGEIAAMDQEMGRLLRAFQKIRGPRAILVVGDHGESLGEHGESQHGNLLYQGAMHVPLVIEGPGFHPGASDAPVSTRRVYHTILEWAGIPTENSLRIDQKEIVLGEAMKPFLQYGWQPQVMAIELRRKVIHAGVLEVYDVISDPAERHDVAEGATLSREVRQALREYPIPTFESAAGRGSLSEEARRRLASLGYAASETKPVIRSGAPRPRDMTDLFETLDRASGAFVNGEYRRAIPLLERILKRDPYNVATALRLAAAHSALGNNQKALAAFRRAQAIAPKSPDVRHYLALHYLKVGQIQRAEPLLLSVLSESPNRIPTIEALARVRERQGRLEEAVELWQGVEKARALSALELVHLGKLAMDLGKTPLALGAFEKARSLQGNGFAHHLELGVLYLEVRRLQEARDALDRVPPSHPGYPMALFKRAQVSVLLGEPDRLARVDNALKHSDATTRKLIEKERLFQRE